MIDMRARAGWEEWYDRHGPALLLLARQHVASAADAEDALHDGFVRFWSRRHVVKDPPAYLYACVRSAALDRSKSARRRERREISEVTATTHVLGRMFEASAENREQEALISDALAQLPPEQRDVVVMKLWGELQFDQIADALQISPNTAASRYRYALEKLRTLINEEAVR
jgi:RNA polymerase sigma-70 factor (ECF subfamily)